VGPLALAPIYTLPRRLLPTPRFLFLPIYHIDTRTYPEACKFESSMEESSLGAHGYKLERASTLETVRKVFMQV
jgi:hypothetical protein